MPRLGSTWLASKQNWLLDLDLKDKIKSAGAHRQGTGTALQHGAAAVLKHRLDGVGATGVFRLDGDDDGAQNDMASMMEPAARTCASSHSGKERT